MPCGIVSYGTYIPKVRVRDGEYKRAWGSCSATIREKAFPDVDEDVLTMAVEASREALEMGPGDLPGRVSTVAVATTSPPYRERVLGSTIAAALDLPPSVFTTEHTSSTKAGIEAMVMASCSIRGSEKMALVVAADAPEADWRDPMEHGLGAGAVAFVLGNSEVLASIEGWSAFTIESMGERFKREGSRFIRDIGVREFTQETFFFASRSAVQSLLKSLGTTPDGCHFFVPPQHDGRAAAALAKQLGFGEAQIRTSLVYDRLGDTGAASTLLGLAAVLDESSPDSMIISLGYGSGAGAIAVGFRTLPGVERRRPRRPLRSKISDGTYVDYVQYLKTRYKAGRGE